MADGHQQQQQQPRALVLAAGFRCFTCAHEFSTMAAAVAAPDPAAGVAQEDEAADGAGISYDTDGLKQHLGSWRDAVRRDWHNLRVAPWTVRADREAVLGAVAQDERALAAAIDDLKSDRGFVVEAVRIRGEALRHATPELRGDKGVVLEAIAQDRLALRHASEAIKADPDVVAASMRLRRNGGHLLCAAEELSAIPAVVREASHLVDASVWRTKVSRDWQKLATAPAAAAADRELVMDAVQNSFGEALRYASEGLRNDRKLVLEAVRLRGTNLQYASKGLQEDVEVVRVAADQDWQALGFASEEVRSNKWLVEQVLAQSMEAFQFVSPHLCADRDLILRCARVDGVTALRYASEDLQRDPEVALEAFKQNSLALRWIPEDVRKIVWEATDVPEFGNRRTTTRWTDLRAAPTVTSPRAALSPQGAASPRRFGAEGPAADSTPPVASPRSASPRGAGPAAEGEAAVSHVESTSHMEEPPPLVGATAE